jgi:hypothetical protein
VISRLNIIERCKGRKKIAKHFIFSTFSVVWINRSRSAMLMQAWHCTRLITDFSVSTRNAEIRDVSCWVSIINFADFSFQQKKNDTFIQQKTSFFMELSEKYYLKLEINAIFAALNK